MDRVQPCLHHYLSMPIFFKFYEPCVSFPKKLCGWFGGLVSNSSNRGTLQFPHCGKIKTYSILFYSILTGSPSTKPVSSPRCVHLGHLKVTFQFKFDLYLNDPKNENLTLIFEHFDLAELN